MEHETREPCIEFIAGTGYCGTAPECRIVHPSRLEAAQELLYGKP